MFRSKLLIFLLEANPLLISVNDNSILSTAQVKKLEVIHNPCVSLTLPPHLSVILFCLQNTSKSILPPPPDPNQSSPIWILQKPHANLPSLYRVCLQCTTLSTKGRWGFKMASQLMPVICSEPATGSQLTQSKIKTLIMALMAPLFAVQFFDTFNFRIRHLGTYCLCLLSGTTQKLTGFYYHLS